MTFPMKQNPLYKLIVAKLLTKLSACMEHTIYRVSINLLKHSGYYMHMLEHYILQLLQKMAIPREKFCMYDYHYSASLSPG
jgi:hypothetical protein